MSGSAGDFSVQVGKWCDMAGDRARLAFLAIAQDSLTRVKELTPVRTGYLRANWQAIRAGDAIPVEPRRQVKSTTEIAVGIAGQIVGGIAGTAGAGLLGLPSGPGAFAAALVGGAAGSEIVGSAAEAIARSAIAMAAASTAAQAQLGDTIMIVNPTSYARAIEHGRETRGKDGALKHTPGRGMVQQTVAEMPGIARNAVQRVMGQS